MVNGHYHIINMSARRTATALAILITHRYQFTLVKQRRHSTMKATEEPRRRVITTAWHCDDDIANTRCYRQRRVNVG